jgi:hypothetical protein
VREATDDPAEMLGTAVHLASNFNRGRRGPRISTTTLPSGHRHIEVHTPVRDKPKPIHSRCWKPEKPSVRWIDVTQVARQQTTGSEFSQFFQSPFIILNVSHEIADNFDLIGIVIRDLDAREFIFDQYHQLQTIEPADAEIVTEVRFIYNPFGINTQILAN